MQAQSTAAIAEKRRHSPVVFERAVELACLSARGDEGDAGAGTRSTGATQALNGANRRPDGVVHDDNADLPDVQSLLANARRNQRVELASTEGFDGFLLLGLRLPATSGARRTGRPRRAAGSCRLADKGSRSHGVARLAFEEGDDVPDTRACLGEYDGSRAGAGGAGSTKVRRERLHEHQQLGVHKVPACGFQLTQVPHDAPPLRV